MRCKVRPYHFELYEVKPAYTNIPTEEKDGMLCGTEINYKKVDDYPLRKVNVFWDEEIYFPVEFTETIQKDLQKVLFIYGYRQILVPATVETLEREINHIIELMHKAEKVFTEEEWFFQNKYAKDHHGFFQKEPLYQYY